MTMEEKVQQQEIMLPVKTLKKLGIDNPKRGMKIALDISISFFQTEKEERHHEPEKYNQYFLVQVMPAMRVAHPDA